MDEKEKYMEKKKQEGLNIEPIKIVICIPGKTFSGRFLDCWSELLVHLMKNKIQFGISHRESCNIYYVRNMCLAGNVSKGKDQKPFDGTFDYDYLLWIDSDMVFSTSDFDRLLKYRKNIVAGIYKFEGGREYSFSDWNEKDFKEKGTMPKCYTQEDLNNVKPDANGLLEVGYTGFGFILIKKGVFESMEYPWFSPEFHEFENIRDFSMDDVSFCLRAKRNGFKIYVDPKVRLYHEKPALY